MSTSPVPFTAFNFAVEIRVPGVLPAVCGAAFSECDGLEMTMDVKTIKEGGNNAAQIRSAGQVGYGQLVLRRGMTPTFDLWTWFTAVTRDPSIRGDGQVVVLAPDGTTPRAGFVLHRLLPLRLKGAPLNARDGGVAIEEMQLAYEALELRDPGAGRA